MGTIDEIKEKRREISDGSYRLRGEIEVLTDKIKLSECLTEESIGFFRDFLKEDAGISLKRKEIKTAKEAFSLLRKAEEKFNEIRRDAGYVISEVEKWRGQIKKVLEEEDIDTHGWE